MMEDKQKDRNKELRRDKETKIIDEGNNFIPHHET